MGKFLLLVVLVLSGLSVPLLLQQGCGERVPPAAAATAFPSLCLAALALEAERRGEPMRPGAERYCSDPELPGRIARLLEMAEALHQEVQVLTAEDAGSAVH